MKRKDSEELCTEIFFLQAEDGIRDIGVTGVQTCALPIYGFASGGGELPDVKVARPVTVPLQDRLDGVCVVHATVEADRKSVVQGKSVDLGGRRILKKKNTSNHLMESYNY